jgi:hypothetical protein
LSIDATGEKDCEKTEKRHKKVARLEFLSQKLILFTAFILSVIKVRVKLLRWFLLGKSEIAGGRLNLEVW